MKTVFKNWKMILSLVFAVIFLAGCSGELQISSIYSFAHPMEDIESIELLVNNNVDAFASDKGAFILIRELDSGEIDSFMSAVYEMETSHCVSPPPRGYGRYVARITYSNGDVEMLGTEHIEFIQFGNEPTGVGAYYFTGDAIEKLILQYGLPSVAE